MTLLPTAKKIYHFLNRIEATICVTHFGKLDLISRIYRRRLAARYLANYLRPCGTCFSEWDLFSFRRRRRAASTLYSLQNKANTVRPACALSNSDQCVSGRSGGFSLSRRAEFFSHELGGNNYNR